MNPQERQDLVRKYFIPKPRAPVGVYIKLAVGLLLLILAIADFGWTLGLLALAALSWGGVGYYAYQRDLRRSTPRATDKQMDDWLDEALTPVVQNGVKCLSVHPTELGSPDVENWRLIFVGIPDANKLRYRNARGTDGKFRFSAYHIMVVYLSNWRMPVYECVLDMETGATVTDETREYSLDQVDGIETLNDRVNIFWQHSHTRNKVRRGSARQSVNAAGHITTGTQKIRLIVSGREAIGLYIRLAEGDAIYFEGATKSSPDLDVMIATLREHIRERHHGALPENDGLADGQPGQLGMPLNLGLEMPREAPE